MALVSLRQLLDHAAENGYGLPAFNVNNLEQIQAIMQAADECNSPVIMQGSADVSYTHLRAHETVLDLVCRLLLEKKK